MAGGGRERQKRSKHGSSAWQGSRGQDYKGLTGKEEGRVVVNRADREKRSKQGRQRGGGRGSGLKGVHRERKKAGWWLTGADREQAEVQTASSAGRGQDSRVWRANKPAVRSVQSAAAPSSRG